MTFQFMAAGPYVILRTPVAFAMKSLRSGEIEQQYLAVDRTLRNDVEPLLLVGGNRVSAVQGRSINRDIAVDYVQPRITFFPQRIGKLLAGSQFCNGHS